MAMEEEQPPLRNLRADPEDGDWGPEDDSFARLQRNDPELRHLGIGSEEFMGDHYFDFPHPDDWGRLGECIGDNEFLERLYFGTMEGVSEDKFDDLCLGISQNRSIKCLEFHQPNLFGGTEFEMLAPFFVLNSRLERLRVADVEFPYGSHPGFNTDGARLLLGALSRCSSLKEITVTFINGDNNEAMSASGALYEALAGNSALQTIDFTGNHVRAGGCLGLQSLLRGPISGLNSLKLSWALIDNAGALALADGLEGYATLKKLDLSDNASTLDLSFNGPSLSGWRALFDVLQNPKCAMEELNLRSCNLDDDSATALANSLANNATIKALDLSGNSRIGADGGRGWEALFGLLHSCDYPTIALEKLELQFERFGSDDVYDLADALSANNKLRELDLSANRNVTSVGWQAILAALGSPESALETLGLVRNEVNDDVTAVAFANVLATNTKLSALHIGTDLTDFGTGLLA